MQAGTDINIMPEYIGSLLETVNNQAGEASGDADATSAALAARLAPLDMSVLGAHRRGRHERIRGHCGHGRPVLPGEHRRPGQGGRPAEVGPAARVRQDARSCAGALLKYGIDISKLQVTELSACGGEMATAIVNGGVQVGELCSTQADIAQNGLVVLTDDLATQPADAVAPIVRNDLLRALDAQGVDIAAVLDPVSAVITTEDLTNFNLRDRGQPRGRRRGRHGLPDLQGSAGRRFGRRLRQPLTSPLAPRAGRSPTGGRLADSPARQRHARTAAIVSRRTVSAVRARPSGSRPGGHAPDPWRDHRHLSGGPSQHAIRAGSHHRVGRRDAPGRHRRDRRG